MKTTIFILFTVFYTSLLGQCPSAGQDSSSTYCSNELFDVADLRSDDADTTGVFIDPSGDTMTNTVISLVFPGQYSFFYHVTDTSCPVDTAKYVITILPNSACTWGLTENTLENNRLIRSNPVNDELILIDPDYDLFTIYDSSGRLVLLLSKGQNTMDISPLEKGNYILIIDQNGTKQFQRFIKI